jgi:hypothetical protein
MAKLHDVVFDCRHPASLARFWAAALDDHHIAPYDEAELARLRSQGIEDPEDDPLVVVETGPQAHPRLLFVLVPEPKTVKNRIHLELTCTDLEAETARLLALGASVHARYDRWITLTDPEGNEFCVRAAHE